MRSRGSTAVVVAALTLAAPAAAAATEIDVLSNRADLISGGDALVEVVPPPGKNPAQVFVRVRGAATMPLTRGPDGRYVGRLEGLRVGENEVAATSPGAPTARITITNHPLGGPVLDGPQIQPWTCADGALDAQCNRPPEYEFLYKSTGGGALRPYDPASPPSDVATTTTDEGNEVPYIVREEVGAIDRDEYRVAVLYDPSKPWDPGMPQDGFNGKMVVFHGASCDTSYEQGDAPGVLNETALSRGFATMSHALDNAGHNCNILTQAEALIMTKERVVEQYGELRYTIGSGCSGGALAQQQVANAYPGFYQGITPACSFPDAWSSAMLYVDYVLLRQYFEEPTRWAPGVAWAPDDIQAVEGHPNPGNAVTFTEVIPFSGEPTRSCPGVPPEDVYDTDTNPEGVRCTLQDYMVNVFGRRDQSVWGPVEQQLGRGFAGRPFDNVGLEYGRKALIAGTITPAQFVDLNAKVGSGDIDIDFQQQRTEADRPALERVYRSGAVNQATNLDEVAIIDLRGPDPGAFHDVYRTYALRARLVREHGHADNQVLWRGQVPLLGDTGYTNESILAMDSWLAAVEADRSDRPLAQKIVANRPDSVGDRCTDGAGTELAPEVCDGTVQSYSTARIEAGMPFTDDTIKCELAPLRRTNYLPVQFNDAQWAELEQAFPRGICDYSKPGVDRVPTVPWLTYRGGPGGQPLGDAPSSSSTAGRARARCARAPRRVRGKRLGRVRLGQRRGVVRRRLGVRRRTGRRFVDHYCLRGGGRLRVGYPSRRGLRPLSGAERRRVRGRAVLILSSSRSSRVGRVRVGMRERVLRARAGRVRGVRVGRQVWFTRAGGRSRLIFKVRRGRVREVGVADRRLTAGRARTGRFFRTGR